MLMSQSVKYQIWGQISVITRYIHPKILSSSAQFCWQNDTSRLFVVDKCLSFGLMEAPKTWIWKHFIYLHRSLSSKFHESKSNQLASPKTNLDPPSKVVVFWVDLGISGGFSNVKLLGNRSFIQQFHETKVCIEFFGWSNPSTSIQRQIRRDGFVKNRSAVDGKGNLNS